VRHVLITLLVVILLIGVAAFAFLKAAVGGFSARAELSAIETMTARWARRAAVPAAAKAIRNPVPETPEILADARAHWADHCASCHANSGSGDTEMGKHMYPPAPDMHQPATQNLSDGELFYVTQNGVALPVCQTRVAVLIMTSRTLGSSSVSSGISRNSRLQRSGRCKRSIRRVLMN
jgi:cytochrome c553